jgi:hypothetical protein
MCAAQDGEDQWSHGCEGKNEFRGGNLTRCGGGHRINWLVVL